MMGQNDQISQWLSGLVASAVPIGYGTTIQHNPNVYKKKKSKPKTTVEAHNTAELKRL